MFPASYENNPTSARNAGTLSGSFLSTVEKLDIDRNKEYAQYIFTQHLWNLSNLICFQELRFMLCLRYLSISQAQHFNEKLLQWTLLDEGHHKE